MVTQAELMESEPSLYTSLIPQKMEVSGGLHSDVPTPEVMAKKIDVGIPVNLEDKVQYVTTDTTVYRLNF